MKTKLLILLAVLSGSAYSMDVSFYRGAVLSDYGQFEELTESGDAVLKMSVGGAYVGVIDTDYDHDVYFAGYGYEVYATGEASINLGMAVYQGYEKSQHICRDGLIFRSCGYDKVTSVLPVATVEYHLNQHVSVQANNTGIAQIDLGLSLNF